MTFFISSIAKLACAEEGQDLLEYAMLVAMIAIVAMLSVEKLGNVINDILWVPIASSI